MKPEPVPRWIILSTVFIAIGVCCAGLFLTGPSWAHLVPSLPAGAARATPLPTFTLIPSRTPTVMPTVTQTPGPITFPAARPTLTPDPSLPLERYKADVTKNLTDMGNALIELGPLLQQPRIGQDDWTVPVAARFAAIQTAHDNLAGIKPPVEAEEFHADLISATADCSAATEQFSRGVDNLDGEYLKSAGELINSCGKKLRALPADFLQ